MLLKPHRRHQSQTRRGFALLITITLLAFLVLLLVSLAALTRVETQVASNGQQLAQARQNALMALNIALGQLQKYAGPDQRVTAPADLIADRDKLNAAAATATSPDPLRPTTAAAATPYAPHITVQPGARYWTGVWGNSRAADYTLRPNSVEYTPANRGGLMPVLLGWLVSGNEPSAFTANANGSTAAPTTAQAPRFIPTNAVGGLSVASKATDKNLTLPLDDPTVAGSTTTPAVLLVGPNSACASGPVPVEALQDFVVAPTVAITVPQNTIPGLDARTTPIEVGRYAWWVGDEGVKSRINRQNGYQAYGVAADQINSFIIAQRSAPEFMDFDRPDLTAANPAGTRIGTDYDFAAAAIPGLLRPSQLSLLGTTPSAQSHLLQASHNRFHDLTTQSMGVLSDTYAGGLKKDLTADIADTSADYSYRPGADTPIFPPVADSETQLPTWKHLRSWARLQPTSPGGAIDPAGAPARAASVFPVIAHFSIGMDYFFDLAAPPPYAPAPVPDGTVTSAKLKLALFPFLVLHNPYSLPLTPADYDFGIRFSQQGHMTLEADHAGNKVYVRLADLNFASCSVVAAGASPGAPTFFRFRIHIDTPLTPGERRIFVLDDADDEKEYSHVSPPVLTRVPSSGTTGIKKYVTITGPDLAALHANLTNPWSRVRIRANVSTLDADENSSLNFAQMSAVLAKSGALASLTWDTSLAAQQDWCQSVLNVFPVLRRMAGQSNDVFFTDTGETWNLPGGHAWVPAELDTAGVSIGDFVANREITDIATAAFRMQSVYEGGISINETLIGYPLDNQRPRFIAGANLRAPFIQATEMETSKTKFLSSSVRGINERRATPVMAAAIISCADEDPSDAGGSDPHPWTIAYKNDTASFGVHTISAALPAQTWRAVLWDILDSPERLLSLGQLQHAPFGRYGSQSSYLFANSGADMRVYRNTTYTPDLLAPPEGGLPQPGYDASWLLNRALWDKYFVSGIPAAWTQADIDAAKPPPNARMSYYNRDGGKPTVDDLRRLSGSHTAYDRAAANLLVAGAFNINSTSEQAWRAVLAGSSGLPANNAYASVEDTVDTAIPYPRFTHNLATTASGAYIAYAATLRPFPTLSASEESSSYDQTTAGSLDWVDRRLHPSLYYGNRGLFLNTPTILANPSPAAVVNELARCIVNEVRRRGPFLSLADFVNRPLTPSPILSPAATATAQSTDERLLAGIKGALQAGIDKMRPDAAQVNPWHYSHFLNGSYIGMTTSGPFAWSTLPLNQHMTGGLATATAWSGSTVSANTISGRSEVYRSSFAMAPKMITQADLLSTLGPHLSARSDTFTIRAYGETRDPATGETGSRAWCEAVVQRTPDYVGGEAPETTLAALPASSPSRTLGRQFRIVSFRWLGPDDI